MRARKTNMQETIVIEAAAWAIVIAVVYLIAKAML